MMDLAAPTPLHLKGSDIEEQIIQSIENGFYARGIQLPSVREMADEFGVNKNTIVRVYRSLHRRGYVRVVQGSGTYVLPETLISGDEELDTLWQARLVEALHNAQQLGVEQEVVTRITLDRIHQVYGNAERRLLFVECNQYDIESLSAILEEAIAQSLPFSHSLQGLLITDFLADPENYIANADLIVTTFFHLNEVEALVNAIDRSKFVAVHAMPTQDALLELARLQVPVLGIVADQPRAMDMMLHIVQTYQRTATIMCSSLEDPVRLQNLLDKADAIVVTQSRYAGLMKHNPQIPVVPLALTISQESIVHLQHVLTALP